ncbi:Tub-like protein [Hamiltosporidium tvaerminnensis]|uniref:Tub-like protein n=1 Tax=Hamiltosporidium tvaerminnensis TaxID=1176355 RepID=A0A4V6MVL6_9MICR|nr:Tub-like protein [Hamiltosporidium tvaerminnensis]
MADDSSFMSPDFGLSERNFEELNERLTPATENEVYLSHKNIVKNHPKMDVIVKGQVVREKKYFRNRYFYEYENGNNTRNRLLKAEKTFFGFNIYSYSGNTTKLCAKLSSNFTGTTYHLYELEKSVPETMIVKYNMCLFGPKGPRSFCVAFGGIDNFENKSISERWRERDLSSIIFLCNKKPVFNAETNSYVLNFNGRVTMPSVKNFQLIHPQEPSYITLTFGKILSNVFVLDYQYPWNAIEAFSIAITALDFKIGCE